MQPRYLMFLAVLLSGAAIAADSTDRTSTVDKNAACMDRDVDASTGNCVIKDEGTPRRTYPYPSKKIPVNTSRTPDPEPVVAPSTVRRAPPAGK